jgi:hypothetical protein
MLYGAEEMSRSPKIGKSISIVDGVAAFQRRHTTSWLKGQWLYGILGRVGRESRYYGSGPKLSIHRRRLVE